jgi:glycosyltransferase involved in cell wall biosynthesis
MRRYLFDARCLAVGGDSGADRVIRGLLTHLPDHLSASERLVVLGREETLDTLVPDPRVELEPSAIPSAGFRQHLEVPSIVRRLAPDVWLYPQYDLPPVPPGIRSIAYVFDLTPLREPSYFGAERFWRALPAAALVASTMARADVVVTCARAIADDLRASFPRACAQIAPVVPGPSLLPDTEPVARRRGRFVYVGNHRPHKRIPLLVRSFARAHRTDPSLELVLAGRTDPRFPEVHQLLEGPLGEGVQWIENPSDLDVTKLLKSARALVFPSVGEGFGFPVVEAFSVATPVIVADAGSLPEVAGTAGLTVPADDEVALADAISTLAEDDGLWDGLVGQIGANLGRFSWPRYAEDMLALLRSVC